MPDLRRATLLLAAGLLAASALSAASLGAPILSTPASGTPALGGPALSAPTLGGSAPAAGPRLGRPATPAGIAAIDISIGADGAGLPKGSGSVAEGRVSFAARCLACHGEAGLGPDGGAVADRLTGGVGTIASPRPIRSVASYWPYAPPLFDYIRRAMPLDSPQSLSDDEVYGLVAYLLSVDGIVGRNARLDAKSLPRVAMPNRGGFVELIPRQFDGNLDRTIRDR
ncbi:cytochrome c [Sphingobium sufflavum]|uniref:c-type cytochrome n=1 Tax=Sphingobium sufflavum TaxID=1129547 RepID=UPI001F46D032|nr:cytochrome c [Sphingobium sufflavum]MCE7795385.1 cytochrome c [Sphingobium sufflavum]